MGAGKVEQGRDRDLQELRVIWSRFGVDSIMSGVASRLLAERRQQVFSRREAPIYGLIGTNILPGNPSLFFAAIGISRPRIISSLEYHDTVLGFLKGSDKVEDVPQTSRAYAIGLNRNGFYARYEGRGATFLERPERIGGSASLRSLINDHIQSQRR